MRHITLGFATAASAVVLMVATGGPAAAAPSDNASCLGKVFQQQAVAAPQTVSDRIHEIRELFLQGTPFGQVLTPLAQNKTCP